MSRRLRKWIDSVVFAGMRPGGPAPSALYLTNRTLWQKSRVAVLVGLPSLILVAGMVLALSNHFAKKPAPPPPEPTPGEVVAKMLANIENVRIDSTQEVEVLELQVDRSGATALTGIAQNKTTHRIRSTEIVFDVTDAYGSQLGGVSQKLEELGPKGRVSFRLPIEQKNARFALVREVHTQ